jgi:hypothetical protein
VTARQVGVVRFRFRSSRGKNEEGIEEERRRKRRRRRFQFRRFQFPKVLALIYHLFVSSASSRCERQVDQAEKSLLLKNLASCLPKNANESQVMGDHYVKVSPAPSMALVSLGVGQGRNYVVAWTLIRCPMSFYPRRSRGIRYPTWSPRDGCTLRVGTPTYHRLIRSVSYSRLSGRGWARLWR